MRTFLAVFVLTVSSLHAQAIRYDWISSTTNSSCASGVLCPILAIPGTTVSVCTGTPSTLAACLASPATTYTDAGAGTGCSTTSQLTPATGGACRATSDNQGNYGFWILPGSYSYFLRVPGSAGGGTYGPYPFSLGASTGCPSGFTCDVNYATLALACSAAGSGTLFVSHAWNGLTSQTFACNMNFGGNGRIQPASGQTVTLSKQISAAAYKIFDTSLTGVVAISSPQLLVPPQWWGALCDGSTTDTAAFVATAATGRTLYIPPTTTYCKLSSPVPMTAVGQGVQGAGHLSKIVQTGTDANANVFVAVSKGHNEFRDLYIVPGTLSTSQPTLYGYAIEIDGSDYAYISGVEVSGQRHGAFILYNSSYGTVTGNFIHDSVVIDSDRQPDSGNDIYIYGASSFNLVSNNQIKNGSGVGVAVQTTSGGSVTANHNTITGNSIDTEPVYGIIAYQTSSSDSVQYTIISNNNVKNVTGNVAQADGQHAFGSCVYVVGAESVVIDGNTFEGCNIYQPTVLLHAPGCIGLGDTTAYTVSHNRCRGALSYAYSTFAITNPVPNTTGRSLWVDNTVESATDTGFECLKVVDVPYLTVHGLQCSGTVSAPAVSDTGTNHSHLRNYTGNTFTNYQSGIAQDGTIGQTTMKDNLVSGNTSNGLLVIGTTIYIEGNTVQSVPDGGASPPHPVGIRLQGTAVNGFVTHNTVSGGIYCIDNNEGATVFLDNNWTTEFGSFTCSTPYTGGDGPMYQLPDSATPSVKGSQRLIDIPSGNAIKTITALTNFTQGQTLTLFAIGTFTIQANAFFILAGRADFVMHSGDTLTLVCRTSSCWEVGRQSH